MTISEKDNNLDLIWDFKSPENLFNSIPNLNLNKEGRNPFLIKNNGGKNIIIENKGIIYNTKGNCSLHAFINYIIGFLVTIDNNEFLDEDVKKSMEEIIIQNLINGVNNMDNNNIWVENKYQKWIEENKNNEVEIKEFLENKPGSRIDSFDKKLFAFSNIPGISKDMFDISIETDVDKILEGGINADNKEFINFFIKLYDIFVLSFKGGYSFDNDNIKIEVDKFINMPEFRNRFYACFLNTTLENIEKNTIKVTKEEYGIKNLDTENPLGSFYDSPRHMENIFCGSEKELSILLNIKEKLNEARPDAGQGGCNTFYIAHKKLHHKCL